MSDLKARIEKLLSYWRIQEDADREVGDEFSLERASKLEDCREDLAALLVGEEPPADQDWCPIATAPNELVLLYRPRLPERDRISIRRRSDWCGPLCCPSAEPTHWMPLPQPPVAASPRLGAAPTPSPDPEVS